MSTMYLTVGNFTEDQDLPPTPVLLLLVWSGVQGSGLCGCNTLSDIDASPKHSHSSLRNHHHFFLQLSAAE
jgi:hypothetical protein